MATVQIAFTDNSDNEEEFNVYRSDSNGTAAVDPTKLVANIAWDANASQWTYTSGAIDTNNDGAFIAGQVVNQDPTNTNSFTLQYTEDTAGVYKYGVNATNGIGASALTESAGSITIT